MQALSQSEEQYAVGNCQGPVSRPQLRLKCKEVARGGRVHWLALCTASRPHLVDGGIDPDFRYSACPSPCRVDDGKQELAYGVPGKQLPCSRSGLDYGTLRPGFSRQPEGFPPYCRQGSCRRLGRHTRGGSRHYRAVGCAILVRPSYCWGHSLLERAIDERVNFAGNAAASDTH